MKNRMFAILGMKQFLVLVLSCVFFSCGEDLKEGGGTNPELNIEQYTFGREGGSIEVYSAIGCPVFILPNRDIEKANITYFKNTNGVKSIDGGWYIVSGDVLGEKIRIETKPNETKRERILPFCLVTLEYDPHTKYTQEP